MNAAADRPRVLCVDDDEFALGLLTRAIGGDYEVLAAASGTQALEVIRNAGPVHVIISDLRMPLMSGAQLLMTVRERHPATVRILLTGVTDLVEAVAAVNQGELFRFLVKPATRDALLETVRAAVEQYRLQATERELLQNTLVGTLRALSDILAIASPLAYGRAHRIRELALAIASRMNVGERQDWPLEYAAMACQLGHITVPEQTLSRFYAGAALTAEEHEHLAASRRIAARLIEKIPRLDLVAEVLAGLGAERCGSDPGSPVYLDVEILRATCAFLAMEGAILEGSISRDTAIERLRAEPRRFDERVLSALSAHLEFEASRETALVPIDRLRADMVVADAVPSPAGGVLAPIGLRISDHFIAKIGNLDAAQLPAAIRVRSR